MKIPRFLLTAGASGSGKTMVVCGLLQALKNRGLKVASFKCGPDYIDPMFHTKVLGTKSRNLDTFFTEERLARGLLKKNAGDCDVAVLEGVMGYYDGVGGTTVKASAYDLARVTDTPAVLIVNSRGMSVSLAAYIKGFLEFRPDSRIQGVILNRMSPMLYPRIQELIERELGIRVYGYVPEVPQCAVESRHLGLVLPEEVKGFQERLEEFAGILERTLDIDGLLELAKGASQIEETLPAVLPETGRKTRLAVARDSAFCFIYEDNLELLKEMGAELVEFSPLRDKSLPEGTEGLLLYGGYPELFGKELEENRELREKLGEAIRGGLPVMAECGGFMYLHEAFEDMEGNLRAGAGVIPGQAYKTSKLSRFGYITVEKKEGTVFGKDVGPCPAHEFHYFDSTNCGTDFIAKKPESSRSWECMHSTEHMLAGFPHFYYYGNPGLAKAFVEKAGQYGRQRREQREEGHEASRSD